MHKQSKSNTTPWILGAYAVYASNLLIAREAYEQVRDTESSHEAFGTVRLESGHEVDWVNIRYGVLRRDNSH